VSQELIQAVMVLTKQKGFAPEVIFESLEAALLQAYRKEPTSNPDAYVVIDRETGVYKVMAKKQVVETVELDPLAKEQVEIEAKYRVFIEREKAQIEKFKKLEEMIIPEDFDYEKVQGLSNIAISGLVYGKPRTIGQASRISGVTYNDIALLIALLK